MLKNKGSSDSTEITWFKTYLNCLSALLSEIITIFAVTEKQPQSVRLKLLQKAAL